MALDSLYVIPRIVKGDDGKFYTVYVDSISGEPVTNLDGKTVLSAGDSSASVPIGANPVKSNSSGSDTSEEEDKGGDYADKVTKERYPEIRRGSERSIAGGTGKRNTNPTQNFGFFDKPGWVSALGALPGTPGIVGKIANGVMNLGNVDSINQGRNALGLDPLSGKEMAKGAIKGFSGQLADANINGKNYSVGFTALSPSGKTNLTTTEANNRRNTLGGVVTPTQELTSKSNTQKALETANKATGGVVTKAMSALGLEKGWATKGLNALFGVTDDNKEEQTSVTPSLSTRETVTSPTANFSSNTPASYSASYGQYRPDAPDESLTNAITSAVSQTFGPGYSVLGISGQQTPAQKARIEAGKKAISKAKKGVALSAQEQADAQYANLDANKNHRHPTGLALDFDVIDPSGKKVTSANQMNQLAANFSYANPEAGVGFGTGYMTDESGLPGRMHLDIAGQPAAWGAKGKSKFMDPGLKETIAQARQAGIETQTAVAQGFAATPGFYTGAVPTARPSYDPNVTVSSLDPVGNTLDPMTSQSFMSAAPQTNVARQVVAENLGLSPATTPAQFAAMGLTARTPEQIDSISRAIAGELSQESLKGVAAGDEEAMREVANIQAAIENRAASKMFDSLEDALDPSQIQSLSKAAAKVTNQNYQTYKDPLTSVVSSFYSNQNVPDNWGVSSYYNPDISNPGWGAKMVDPNTAGAHLFGSLPEYGPNRAFSRALGAYTSKDNYAGGGTSIGYGAYDTPSERNASMRMDGNNTGMYGGSTTAGLGAPGTGMGLRDTTNGGTGSSSSKGIGSSSGGGLNSAGNRASGAGPMSGKNTNTSSGSSKSSSSKSSSSSASHEANSSRSSTSSGSGKSAGTAGGHNAD